MDKLISIYKFKYYQIINWLNIFLSLSLVLLLLYVIYLVGAYAFGATKKIRELEKSVSKSLSLAKRNKGGSKSNQKFTKINYEDLLDSKLFSLNTSSVIKTIKDAKKNDTNFELVGIYYSKQGGSQAILLNKKTKEEDVFEIGDKVFSSETKLKDVLEDKVVLSINNKDITLNLDDSQIFNISDGGSANNASVKEVSLNKSKIEEALENIPMLLTQARAVPYFKNGEVIGLRLFAIKPGSIFEEIGLKNGDILKSINNKQLGNFHEALNLFNSLKEEKELVLVLERLRKELVYKYKIE